MQSEDYDYDICLSFAGEQRVYVQQVAESLKSRNVRVFYDAYEQASLWGKDLYEHLDLIYRKRALYCIIFVSEDYSRKVWTGHERASAQARALQESVEYVLPARFDDTEIPGMPPTLGYIDLRFIQPDELAALAAEKVSTRRAHVSASKPTQPPLSYLKGTQEEQEFITNSRPSGWEYLLFSSTLISGRNQLAGKLRDHELRYARTTRRIDEKSAVLAYIQTAMANAVEIVENFKKILTRQAQEWAFGPVGVEGNVENIVHLGKRFIGLTEDFIDWAADLRGTATRESWREVFELAAQLADKPIRQLTGFVDKYSEATRNLSQKLDNGERVELGIPLPIEIDDAILAKLNRQMKRL
ncbi:hypothetical protein GCM10010174_26280 [Kutzneria viridogrisea]|uniref:TIR domain-containing protein n=1 Tax=Kutzneria viridogrisea TaxID=47990 RepID=A0ABR6BRN2_9PSEU|nr:hypothetical protein [Kutzneria viridogrisea]